MSGKRISLKRSNRELVGLSELRTQLGVTQASLAAELGTSQQAVLKVERSGDPQVSTVRKYLEALGSVAGVEVRLDLVAVVKGRNHRLSIPREEPIMKNQTLDRVRSSLAAAPRNLRGRRTTPVTAERAWRLRAWDDPEIEDAYRELSLIAMGGHEIRNLTKWPGDAAIAAELRSTMPDRSEQAISTFVRYWNYFCIEMRIGDLVAVPYSGRRVSIGVVTGNYRYDDTKPEDRLWHRREVRWLGVIPRSELDDDLRKVVNAPGTICRFNAPDAPARLRSQFGGPDA